MPSQEDIDMHKPIGMATGGVVSESNESGLQPADGICAPLAPEYDLFAPGSPLTPSDRLRVKKLVKEQIETATRQREKIEAAKKAVAFWIDKVRTENASTMDLELARVMDVVLDETLKVEQLEARLDEQW